MANLIVSSLPPKARSWALILALWRESNKASQLPLIASSARMSNPISKVQIAASGMKTTTLILKRANHSPPPELQRPRARHSTRRALGSSGHREILRDLTCSFSGRTIGLLGPNGAGKSTLINTLLGFWPLSAGSARIFGSISAPSAKKIRALIGYMPENDAFIGNMSAVSFIRLMAELSGLPPAMALERAHEALFYVGLGEARYRKLGTYSLGMKQLAKLAQAIVHGPKLLILDEPTNGLDPPARQRMIRLIREMRDSRRDAHHSVLAPAARRGRDLRRGGDPQAGPRRPLLESRRRAAVEPALPRTRTRWRRRWLSSRPLEKSGLRVRARSAQSLQAGAAPTTSRSRDIYRIAAERERAASPPEFPPRHARRHFPQSHGDRQWPFINAPIADTPARSRPPGRASWCSIVSARRTLFRSKFQTGFFVLCFFFPLLCLLGIYANSHLSAFAFLSQRPSRSSMINGKFFWYISSVQARSPLCSRPSSDPAWSRPTWPTAL